MSIPRVISKPRRKLKDGPAVLDWVLARFEHRIRRRLGFDASQKLLAERVVASLTLTRAAASHGVAILASTRRRVSEAAITNVRTMLELWADQRLVLQDESNSSLRRMYVSGALAIASRDETGELVKAVEARYPAEVALVRKQRPFSHWSGRGRKQVIGEVCGAHYATMYESYSWDAHPIAQVALDVHALNIAEHRLQVRHRTSEPVVAKQVSVVAAHIIRDMWNRTAPLIRRAPS